MIVQPTNAPGVTHHAVDWVLQQAKRETDAIGFLPRGKYHDLHRRGRLIICHEDGELLGWCLHGPSQPTTRVYQICIREDCRRLLNATAIVHYVGDRAHREGANTLLLRCADDLTANLFWKAVGFAHVAQERGGLRRGRLINVYELNLARQLSLVGRMVWHHAHRLALTSAEPLPRPFSRVGQHGHSGLTAGYHAMPDSPPISR